MKRIFITGGTGFFGKSMLDWRLRHPEVAVDEWTILSRDPGRFMKRYPRLANQPGVRFRQGDVRTFSFGGKSYGAVIHGEIPRTILCPGYSTYYTLRQQGHQQIAIGDAGGYADTDRVTRLLDNCDAILIEHEDKYAPMEESLTFYGVLRNYCLSAARQESAQTAKSLPAQIGEAFAYGSRPDMSELIAAKGFTLRESHGQSLSYTKPAYLLRKPRNAPVQHAE